MASNWMTKNFGEPSLVENIRQAAINFTYPGHLEWMAIRSYINNEEWPRASHEDDVIKRMHMLFVANVLESES